jgi:hypothetical protein
MPACITGSVNEELLQRIEYLIEENRVLRNQPQKALHPVESTIETNGGRFTQL